MTKPFGYFGLSQENPLIKDITETFGDGAAEMGEDDTFWLIYRIAYDLWENSPEPLTDEAEEIESRLNELKSYEKIALIRALIQP